MMTPLVSLIVTLLFALVTSFHRLPARLMKIPASRSLQTLSYTPLIRFDAALQATNPESEYWQGEWVCADCGYVYDRDFDGNGLYFEQQKKGFICPQCSAPRRRYAKKVGDKWGVTNDGGDWPIYALTFLGLGVTAWFSLSVVPTL